MATLNCRACHAVVPYEEQSRGVCDQCIGDEREPVAEMMRNLQRVAVCAHASLQDIAVTRLNNDRTRRLKDALAKVIT